MAQIKIYGLRDHLRPIKAPLSDVIHECIVEAFGLPRDKKFHRFFPIDAEDFFFPADRSEKYTIIEISLFEGRTISAKKKLIRLLFLRLGELGIAPEDLEITLSETPRENWGIRGLPADEIELNYTIEV